MLKNINNILIITAMDVEEEAVSRLFNLEKVDVGFDIKVSKLLCVNKNIYITNSGIGLANAAINTAILSNKLKLDLIILAGVGGALNEKLEIGDIVISDKVIQHDSLVTYEDHFELVAPGNFFLSIPLDKRASTVMHCDKEVVSIFYSKLKDLEFAKTYIGTLLSGSEFVANSSRKEKLALLDENAYMVDMEAAAVAQVSIKYKIPFIVVKTVSDKVSSENIMISEQYKKFLNSAARNIQEIFNIIISEFMDVD